ncbi:16S rRNA (adenine(1518)-N(6)/adenine(1519)-N(6))-dimethyltransferase RsmA [Galbitalea sp. SE-J8]|uniref:16S rRNA (adenine(1518)-N(6)/adenine(1519)-N(6))- dimethyltransferase RsmA n=1 Tax=Galbitalea sp. SE-J8 TaxID=3054952 RepID=UPI00259D055D|nr:16S rRNA (adenine(1518)-N(6)/adenine(1519)-N(6))-dimethyltransferase RsmA [Galbitalea sp. SE-J8]MDM4762826.1 16S rRNA (adenine(1518)-N(6)/adenine(1519)-N(6))-dimethyltransferase RsmA [Galbitalea sp. SE-J8]
MRPVRLLGPAEIRDLAELLGVTPTKKWGQNFVHDANTVRRIVQLARVTDADTVLEVGPGLGSLTLGLLETGAPVVAIEIDRRLAEQLPRTVAAQAADEPRSQAPSALASPQPWRVAHGSSARLTVINADALQVTELPVAPTVLVANLPYNVSVPVLIHLLERVPSLERGVVMVQAEVGQRLAAAPGSRVYGAPSAKVAWWAHWRVAGQVSRQVFWPVPNVDSVLVAFERHDPPGSDDERVTTFAVIDAAFGQRRKMLRGALASLAGDPATASAKLEAAGVAPTARGEELALVDFLRIARA